MHDHIFISVSGVCKRFALKYRVMKYKSLLAILAFTFTFTFNLVLPKTALAVSQDVTCNGNKGVDTAIGCLNVLSTPEDFLGQLLGWAVGIGGGLAFILIVYAGFMIMTAAGNPERLKAGQELLTSAISGLILLIFSIFVLRFIGIDILGLNNFGFGG